MKKFATLLLVPILLLLGACKSIQSEPVEAMVISDCTGVYLQIEGLDYLVCNQNLVKSKVGQSVKVSFEKISECPEFKNKAVCLMYHKNEGLVRISALY